MSPALKLHQLRCVVAAARRGSFRQAAAALNIQQSTVSRSVRALEDHLGVSIFERGVRGARLTPAGDQFPRGAELALEQLGRAAGSAAAAGREERHVLRIASVALPGYGFLPELLRAMAKTRPRPPLWVREATSAENLRGLCAAQVDLAIVLGDPAVVGCAAAPLWTERLFLVGGAVDAGRRGAPAAWADAQAAALILPPGDLGAVIAERLAACARLDIDHRLTKPRHPWTNGQVERMNRTLKEPTVKRYHYETHDELRTHLGDFVNAYNFARRLKTMKGLTPTSTSAKSGQKSPNDSTSIQPSNSRD